jgi:hypothetical protein
MPDAARNDAARNDAARNNAEWCDIVCRSHGLPTRFDDDVWSSLHRSPPWYPDAVTLRPGVEAREVLSRVDTGPGCSVKDSFADLDLAPAGFRVLFEAQWVHRRPGPAPTPDGPAWRRVTTADRMRAWLAAHDGGGNLRCDLVDHPLVAVLAAYDGDVLVGGAITNRSEDLAGVSNVFGVGRRPEELWPGVVAAVVALHPGVPLVGYEEGPSLEAALAAGFARVGPLCVWVSS